MSSLFQARAFKHLRVSPAPVPEHAADIMTRAAAVVEHEVVQKREQKLQREAKAAAGLVPLSAAAIRAAKKRKSMGSGVHAQIFPHDAAIFCVLIPQDGTHIFPPG